MVLYVGALSPITAAGFTVMGRSCEEEAGEKEKRRKAKAHKLTPL